MMKKIVFFLPRMGGGGAERVVSVLANWFSQKYEVLIYTATDNSSFYLLDDRVRIEGAGYRVSKNKLFRPLVLGINGLRLCRSFKKKMQEESPDAVISFMNETSIIASLQRGRNYRLIISERNDPVRKSPWMRRLVKRQYAKADFLVCQTAKAAQFFGSPNCVVIENPVCCTDTEIVFPEERKKEIVAVGRLMPQKNFSMLIQAFRGLDGRYSEYVLKIYGEGVLREKLQRQIRSLCLQDRVFLMGARQNVVEEYRDASLFVMSSDYEGFPNALTEAMAAGLPVICTDFATGAAEQLVGEKNGRLVPVGDVYAMTKAIEDLLKDRKTRDAMSRENYKIREKYSVDQIGKKWTALISGERGVG